jgi:hypothetical protein
MRPLQRAFHDHGDLVMQEGDAKCRLVQRRGFDTPFVSGTDVAISFADHGVTLLPNS